MGLYWLCPTGLFQFTFEVPRITHTIDTTADGLAYFLNMDWYDTIANT